jgi:hypothetical protein
VNRPYHTRANDAFSHGSLFMVQNASMQRRQRTREIRRVDLTDVELASSGTARKINRDIVLELVRTQQPISRADLARQSGLQRSTISQISEQLLAGNWVCEGEGIGFSFPGRVDRGRRGVTLRRRGKAIRAGVDA